MKNYYALVFGLLSVLLVGCSGDGDSVEVTETAEVADADYVLSVVETKVNPNQAPVVQLVDVPEAPVVPKFEVVQQYADFSSATYVELQGAAPFALFFTADDCERCRGMHTFFKNNLSVLPNHTQILKVQWDAFPNLQTELNVRRPATMVLFNADGSVNDTLLAPPLERIIDFFVESQPTSE